MIRLFFATLLMSTSCYAGELTTGYTYLNSTKNKTHGYRFYFDNYNRIGENQLLNIYGQVEYTGVNNNGYLKIAPGHKFNDNLTGYFLLEYLTESYEPRLFQRNELIDNRVGISLEYKVRY